jgi:uncharacterized ion transporter superfamily protein YfcC
MMAALRIPHTLVLLFGMMMAALVLTWVLPAGSFDLVEGGRAVVPGTFAFLDDARPLNPLALFTVIPRALADAQGIIFFVLIVGGALAVIRQTGAIDAFLGSMLQRFGHRVGGMMFAGMFAFGAASSTFGMAEEYIPIVAVLITLCAALRLDTVAAVATMVVGYGIGFGAAALNPFTVMIAKDIAQLAPGSGLTLRLAIFVPLLLIGFHHVYRYAKAVQADPAHSVVFGITEAQPPMTGRYPAMTHTHVGVLLAMLSAVALLVVGIVAWGWYLVELSALFFGLSVAAALIARLGADDTARVFGVGAAELSMTALLIGFARSIALLLEDGQVLHTIVYGLSIPLSAVPPELAAIGMLLIQSALNLFIPSGSGQAYVTMPLMAPIADLVGLTRQTAVLAYQFGDGFMNMVVPTNPVLMGILGIAGIPYDRWLRFIWPLMLKLLLAASAILVFAVWTQYS